MIGMIKYLLMLWFIFGAAQASVMNPGKFSQQRIQQTLDVQGPGFTAPEHKSLGDSITLRWAPLSEPENKSELTLPNGLKVSYGEIIFLAGDLFGNPQKPVSSCTEKSREECFYAQFYSLGIIKEKTTQQCEDPFWLVKAYRDYFKTVEDNLARARQQGQKDWDFYKQHEKENTEVLNRIGCGGSVLSIYFPLGTYLQLAQENMDHFVPDSLKAYRAGHAVALKSALKAREYLQNNQMNKAKEMLELAYAQNAFANHYLTDSMSAGHMRTPRRVIHNVVTLPDLLKVVLANFMHNEDSKYGLNVVNSQGLNWRAYGDGYLNHPDAATHKEVIIKIVQLSADAIYNAFNSGTLPEKYDELDWMPDFGKIEALNNHSPLFKVEDGLLLKRVKNDDPFDYEWTADWNSWATLIELQSEVI